MRSLTLGTVGLAVVSAIAFVPACSSTNDDTPPPEGGDASAFDSSTSGDGATTGDGSTGRGRHRRFRTRRSDVHGQDQERRRDRRRLRRHLPGQVQAPPRVQGRRRLHERPRVREERLRFTVVHRRHQGRQRDGHRLRRHRGAAVRAGEGLPRSCRLQGEGLRREQVRRRDAYRRREERQRDRRRLRRRRAGACLHRRQGVRERPGRARLREQGLHGGRVPSGDAERRRAERQRDRRRLRR